MTGKHTLPPEAPLAEETDIVMPDPDNLQVDLSRLPLTAPITLPRRESVSQ